MTLDLGAASKQIRVMAEALASSKQRNEDLLSEALRLLKESPKNFHALRERVENNGHLRWPIARPLEYPASIYPLPEIPKDYTIVATDGSQIEPDRHGPVLCYLINIGSATICYGSHSFAKLESQPTLGYLDKDIYVNPDDRQSLITGDILDAKRNLAEAMMLAEKAIAQRTSETTVAVQDGTLLIRTAESWKQDKFVKDKVLDDFKESLSEMRKHGVLVSSYVSRPRSTEVVNLLRLMHCPHHIADCETMCSNPVEHEFSLCSKLAGMLDGDVFQRVLKKGQRSATFLSSSPISLEHYGEHKACFFYLHVGPEIARVEIPEWVAQNTKSLDSIHATLYHQAQNGGGYPRVLIEAHEKAIITAGERRQFEDLLEINLANSGLNRGSSQKQISKRVRGL